MPSHRTNISLTDDFVELCEQLCGGNDAKCPATQRDPVVVDVNQQDRLD